MFIQEITYQYPQCVFSHFSSWQGALFLDSAAAEENGGRYSFIAIDPFETILSENASKNFFDLLNEKLNTFSLEFIPDLPPFQGGAAGYFGYDLCHHLEKLPKHPLDDMKFPDAMIGLYDLVIAYDYIQQRSWIFSSGYPEQNNHRRNRRAKKRLQWLLCELKKIKLHSTVSYAVCDKKFITAHFTKEHYQSAVQRVKEYILAGDIFQANLSQRFKAILPPGLTPYDLYRRLRMMNPAPFAAFINSGEYVIASASPERFLKLVERTVETRPIKGTRPRGATVEEDKKLAKALSKSEKDRAENIMIVDLLRNDLSRVCENHSVKVTQLCEVESFATVHHLVSVVRGMLKPHLTAIDLLRATFPGGSITGAPKIRAMEIIAELELTARGPYCGSIGYIGFNGVMDTSIAIRTFCIKNNIVTYQVGGGIVADSDPSAEYEETLTKGRALLRALTENDFTY